MRLQILTDGYDLLPQERLSCPRRRRAGHGGLSAFVLRRGAECGPRLSPGAGRAWRMGPLESYSPWLVRGQSVRGSPCSFSAWLSEEEAGRQLPSLLGEVIAPVPGTERLDVAQDQGALHPRSEAELCESTSVTGPAPVLSHSRLGRFGRSVMVPGAAGCAAARATGLLQNHFSDTCLLEDCLSCLGF